LSRSGEAFPFRLSEQWQGIAGPLSQERSGITAAGTVAVSHRIPFSLQHLSDAAKPESDKYMTFYVIYDRMWIFE
jgi:hypothetical protein